MLSRPALRWLLAGYLVLVLRITLWPGLGVDPAVDWLEQTLAWLHARGLPEAVGVPLVEAVANVVMFVPLGLLLPLTVRALGGTRRWWAVGSGLLLSALIETCQLLFLPDRVPTLQDVAMNTLGALVGVALVPLVASPSAGLHRRIRHAQRDQPSDSPPSTITRLDS